MPHCIFVHRADSIYDDIPAVRYQFPAPYLARARQCVGDWVVYFEPVKVPRSRGYFAVARVEAVVPDPDAPGRWRALIEPGTYLEFAPTVPRRVDGALVERDCASFCFALKRRAPGIRPAWLPRISSGGRSALRSAGRGPDSR